MSRAARQMSKKAATLVAAFDEAAQWFEWTKKNGSPDQKAQAEVERQKAFDKLRRYITRLEYFREAQLRKGIGK